MMSYTQSSQSQIIDTPYSFNYFKELSPVNLNYVAALNSFTPCSIEKEFTYCDLNCGNGISINLLAAAYPQGKFIGIDSNPQHIENAKKMTQQGHLNNVNFTCISFNKINSIDIPACDFIVLHSIINYLGEKYREIIFEIIKQKLKPNGLIYVSYNAMPGWANSIPVRETIKQYTDQLKGNVLEKAQAGLNYLRLLQEEKAAIFQNNQVIKNYLDVILQEEPSFIVHEYLQKYCNAFYFKEINSCFKKINMGFTGSMPFFLNHKPFAIPRKLIKYFDPIENREFLETQKDFIINSFSRRDVFASEKKRILTPEERNEYFKNCYFSRISYIEKPITKIVINRQNFTLTGEVYIKLQELFKDGIYSIGELCNQPNLKNIEESSIAMAVRNLVAFGVIFPCQTKGVSTSIPEKITRLSLLHPINKNLAVRSNNKTERVALASQVLGGAIKISLTHAHILGAIVEGKKTKESIAKYVTEKITSQMAPSHINKQFYQGNIEKEIAHFQNHVLPILFRLGVVKEYLK